MTALQFALVLIALVMAQVLHRAKSASIGSVANIDAAIHILKFDARTPVAQLTPQVISHEAVMVDVQSEIIIDSP
jgi:hypothetical protein